MMATALLGRGDVSTSQLRLVERIGRAADRAQHLIADLLDFTQARLGQGLSLEKTSFDLHEVSAECLEDLRLAHPTITLVHVRHGDGECTADVNRLVQLLGNLVSNAATYGEPQAPITVTSTVAATSFSLAVHNHGVPIAPDVQTMLFEPMTRGTNVHSKARSVGLGLFIVREIARAHGGTAEVRSAPDEGTTFEVTFPRTRDDRDEVKQSPRPLEK
jgi:phosphoserine phosphatase RsbU/P